MNQINRLDHQDRMRYWKISQIKASARVFADAVENGFRELFGHLAAGDAQGAFAAVGTLFHLTGGHLTGQEKDLDRARYDRAASRIKRRKTGRRRKSAYKATRGVICRIRQFADSVTGGQADVFLGIRGPTPRDPERLAAWGGMLQSRLPELDLSPAARALAAALAEELEPLVRELLEAIEEAESARIDEKLDNAELKRVRKTVDAEIDKVVRFLRTNLELIGQDYLASRVLGKRRGRPRKSARARKEAESDLATAAPESDVELSETATGGQEIDSAPSEAEEGGRKYDSAPSAAAAAGRKFDSTAGHEVPAAFPELQEVGEAPNKASTAVEEIAEEPSEACTALEKIAEVPCKPCTEPSRNEKVASFQQDTPRSTRWRRRRIASALLGASKRLLPSGWMGRIVTGDRSQGRGADRG